MCGWIGGVMEGRGNKGIQGDCKEASERIMCIDGIWWGRGFKRRGG